MKKIIFVSLLCLISVLPSFSGGFKEDESKWISLEDEEEIWIEDPVFVEDEEEIEAENLKLVKEKSDEKEVLKENQKIEKEREKLYKSEKQVEPAAAVSFGDLTANTTKSEIEQKYPSLENVRIGGVKFKKVRVRYNENDELIFFSGSLKSRTKANVLEKRFSKKYRYDTYRQAYFAKNMDMIEIKKMGYERFLVLSFR